MNETNNQCARCSAIQEGALAFLIGAKSDFNSKDWVLVEGTGKLVCPECYPAEMDLGRALIEQHIANHNARAHSFQ